MEISLANKNYLLEILVERDVATVLASPLRGHMDGRIEESMLSHLEINLVEVNSGKSMFYGRGRNTAVEVAGRVEEIITG